MKYSQTTSDDPINKGVPMGRCPSYVTGSSPLNSKNCSNFGSVSRTTQQVQSVLPEIGKRNSHSRIRQTSNHKHISKHCCCCCSCTQNHHLDFSVLFASFPYLSIYYEILSNNKILKISSREGREAQKEQKNLKMIRSSFVPHCRLPGGEAARDIKVAAVAFEESK